MGYMAFLTENRRKLSDENRAFLLRQERPSL